MAKEYIERNELIENLNRFAPEHYNALINQLITKQPTTDVVEVKHGEWADKRFVKVGGLTKAYPSVECSNCGNLFCDIVNNHKYMYRYCPNCGAKMDGGTKVT